MIYMHAAVLQEGTQDDLMTADVPVQVGEATMWAHPSDHPLPFFWHDGKLCTFVGEQNGIQEYRVHAND